MWGRPPDIGGGGLAVNILNKQSWTAEKGWSSSLGLGMGLTIPHHKKKVIYCKIFQSTSDLD
jgi:hypothetical protein